MDFKELMQQVIDLKEQKQWEQYREHWESLLNQHEEVKAVFQTWTVKKLSGFVGRREKKAILVSMAVDRFYTQFCIPFDAGAICTHSGGLFDKRTDHEVRIDFFNSYTEERFEKYLQRQEETEKAISNPRNIDQYRTKNNHVGLTDKETISFYRLLAIAEVSRKAEAFRIPEIKTADFQIVEAYHDKKNIPLFVAQLTKRVDIDEFKELRTRAKSLGGYYSKFARGNAKPGFQFETEDRAKQFAGIEDIDTEALREEAEAAANQSTAERLRHLANRWEESGEESLRSDRLDNTVRRARMAAIAEETASMKIARAKTLRSIADALDMGNAGALAGIKYATDLETLFSQRSRAKYRFISENKIAPDMYPPFDLEKMLSFVRWPHPELHPERLRRAFGMHQNTKGYTMAIRRILKKAQGETPVQVRSIQEDLKKCLPLISSEWERSYIQDAFTDDMRLRRMGLTNRAHLIGALAELENHISGNETPERIKEKQIDRKFIGRDIAGFFPTPEALTMHILTMIDFPEGCSTSEPGAGLGHLAKFLPDPECFEINPDLADALKEKGFNVVGSDWLQNKKKFDRIVMNPPFEKGQAETHTRHAYDCLKPNGKLVSVLPANVSEDFQQWAQDKGNVYPVRHGEFKTAFRRTGVSVRLVYLEKGDDNE